MSDYRICPRCDGDGWADEYRGIECRECNGDGEIEIWSPLPDYPWSTENSGQYWKNVES